LEFSLTLSNPAATIYLSLKYAIIPSNSKINDFKDFSGAFVWIIKK